jgi:glycosyltransferase involved in cell wall biosynthesis
MRAHEVIAVDDGSRDGSGELLERAAARDPRIVVARAPARGLVAALNTALARARAPFLARMDADDAHRRRLELQAARLYAEPDCPCWPRASGTLGGWCRKWIPRKFVRPAWRPTCAGRTRC